ncbi:protein bric-a-brac 2 isoform X2 [Anoplophora glabripennis]|uniref:protein bric-a-brac 2 isoform X2 n=1 Tax=Anoplophora glabripennis TaxID=217634 RepID=UPI000873DC05|nr:protein bric-a-brac 2 isoform X2 [Anoplophora glabripennis]
MSSDVTKQFAVNWNNHMNHVKKAFDNLLVNSELTDVILYAEGKKVGAHKMLLSACSNYFRSLFREFPQEHPIIVLKGVSYPVLTDILKFIYNGEVSVDSDVFDNFLQTAEFLQISGLTDGGKNTKKIQNGDKDTVKDDSNMNDEEHGSLVESKTKKEKRSNVDAEQNTQSKRPREETEFNSIKCEPGVLTAIFPEELSDTLQEASQFPPELILQAGSNVSVDDSAMKIEDVNSCETSEEQFYDETSPGSSIRAPKYNFSENRLKCPICDKEFSHPYSLHHHKPVHLGGTKCPICHVVLSRKYNLKMHMRSRHNIT